MSVFMMERLRVRLVNGLPQRLERVLWLSFSLSYSKGAPDGGPPVYREPASAHSESG